MRHPRWGWRSVINRNSTDMALNVYRVPLVSSLGDEFTQRLCRPNTELRGLVTVHPVADGNDGVQVVKFHLALNLASSLAANHFHFGNSCLSRQLTRCKNVGQVLVDGRNLNPEQLRQRLLCQPDRFGLIEDISAKLIAAEGCRKCPACGYSKCG